MDDEDLFYKVTTAAFHSMWAIIDDFGNLVEVQR